MVVPIAATAWELAGITGDDVFLVRAYAACARWDEWLRRHRDTRGTGLCEMFCEYDTGHDNSPRCKGMPHACPGQDAAVCPDAPGLPRPRPGPLGHRLRRPRRPRRHGPRPRPDRRGGRVGPAGGGDPTGHHGALLRPGRRLLLRRGRRRPVRPHPQRRPDARARRGRGRPGPLRGDLPPPHPQPRGVLDALPAAVHRGERSGLREVAARQLLGRPEPGPHGAARPALDAALRQVRRPGAPDAAVGARAGRRPASSGSSSTPGRASPSAPAATPRPCW